MRLPTGHGLVFVVGATVFVLAVALFAVSRSPLFALRHVEVVELGGTGHRSVAEIEARAAIPAGANVVWLDTPVIAARLEADPWVARATVTRSLPWSVRIQVVERMPIAVVEGATTGTYVAADGTRLGPAAASARLPVIALPPASPATVGPPGEEGAIRALRAMAPSVRHRVREVDVLVGRTLTLRLRGGSLVELGRAVELDEKARVLRRLLVWERTTGTRLGRLSLVAPTAPAALIAP